MADINIVYPHKLSDEKAHAAAQKVAEKLAAEYEMEYEWEDKTLHFERSGVNGYIDLQPGQVEMRIQLGFLMSAFSSTIEAKVREQLKKVFG